MELPKLIVQEISLVVYKFEFYFVMMLAIMCRSVQQPLKFNKFHFNEIILL